MNSTRQSRYTAWAYFSKIASQKAASPDGAAGASEISRFVPSCAVSAGGERRYQVIAIRAHVLGKPKFALVEEVIRGSLTKKGRRTGKKVAEHPVDAHMVAAVRGVVLEPVSKKDEEGMWHFRCTVRSPSAIFQVADEEGTLLWAVPENLVRVQETAVSLELAIKDEAYVALRSFNGTGDVPNFKAKAEEPASVKVSYTIDAFKQKKHIIAYVDVMRKMLLKTLGSLMFFVSFLMYDRQGVHGLGKAHSFSQAYHGNHGISKLLFFWTTATQCSTLFQ